MKADDRLEVLTMIGQGVVLTAGFALVFSWQGEFALRALLSLILVLLVLIYPMPDRTRAVLQQDMRELQKAHGLTQALLVELRTQTSQSSDDAEVTSEEKTEKAQGIATELEALQAEFGDSFDAAFEHERALSGADRVAFLGNALGLLVYLGGLIGGSALLGWFVARAVLGIIGSD